MESKRQTAEAVQRTDVGLVREENEDAAVVLGPEAGNWDVLLMVADGMGGHRRGREASHYVVAEVAALLRTRSESWGDDDLAIEQTLIRSVEAADRQLSLQARDARGAERPGTTLTLAVLRGRRCYIAHAGDSRAYLLRAGRAFQITEDHTWVQAQVRQGRLTEDEARQSPYRNQLVNSLGAEQPVEPDTHVFDVDPRDVLLLCTDGLTEHVTDEEIADILTEADSLDEAADLLIKSALAAGGRDNVTVVLCRPAVEAEEVPAEEPEAEEPAPMPAGEVRGTPEPPVARSKTYSLGSVAIVALLAAVIVLLVIIWRGGIITQGEGERAVVSFGRTPTRAATPQPPELPGEAPPTVPSLEPRTTTPSVGARLSPAAREQPAAVRFVLTDRALRVECPEPEWTPALMRTGERGAVTVGKEGITYRFRFSASLRLLREGKRDLVAVRQTDGKGERLTWTDEDFLEVKLATGVDYKCAYGGTLPLFNFRIVPVAGGAAAPSGATVEEDVSAPRESSGESGGGRHEEAR